MVSIRIKKKPCNGGEKAAEQGHADAKKAPLRQLMERAEQGDAIAQSNLGVMYANGEGVTQDYEKAVEWYQKAAQQGFANAQYNLGVMYEHSKGVTQDYEKAVEWYQKSC